MAKLKKHWSNSVTGEMAKLTVRGNGQVDYQGKWSSGMSGEMVKLTVWGNGQVDRQGKWSS